MARVYHGRRATRQGGPQPAWVTDDDGGQRPLIHYVRHSPDGFQWGYGGSGPSDLALSILWDHLGAEPDPEVYRAFTAERVAGWGDAWRVDAAEIDDWLTRRGGTDR